MKRVGPDGWGARLANPGKIPLELIEVQVGRADRRLKKVTDVHYGT
jgi:mannose-6-phosphate isomerase-like protein (cupin superfamily)